MRYRADQVVVGIAINLLAIGATRFFLRLAFDSSSNSPRVPGFDWYVASGDAASGPSRSSRRCSTRSSGRARLAAAGRVAARAPPFGLRVRAVGEKPEAAEPRRGPGARAVGRRAAGRARWRRSAACISRSTSTSSPTT